MMKKGKTVVSEKALLAVVIVSIFGVLSMDSAFAQAPGSGAASQIPGGMPQPQPQTQTASGIGATLPPIQQTAQTVKTVPSGPSAGAPIANQSNPNVQPVNNPAAGVFAQTGAGLPQQQVPPPQINYGMPQQQLQQPQQVYVTTPQGMPQGIPVETAPAVDPRDPAAPVLNMLNTPDARIREINRKIYDKARVINEPPVPQPEAVISTAIANLSPGSMPPVVRLFKNRSTSIVMTDNTGASWPIINYEIGSAEDFTVRRIDKPSPEGSVLTITPNGSHVSANIILFLKDLPTPVVLDLVSAQKKVDYRVDVRVQAKGPNAQMVAAGLPDQIDTRLLAVLSGIAPAGAKDLKTTTGAVQAWLAKDGKMFVRTRYRVMSPAFEQVTSSPDGTYAYKMQAVPVVLYKYGERMGEIGIDGF